MRARADELSVAQQRLAELSETFAPAAWCWSPASDDFVATPRLREVLGFDKSATITIHSLAQLIVPDDRHWFRVFDESAETAVGDDLPLMSRFRIRRADNGDLRWISSRIWRNGSHGDPSATVGYSGIFDDITEQTETARALVESTERLRLAIEAGKMAVWEVDLDSGAMTPSPELNILLGFEPDATPSLNEVRALYAPGEIERLAKEGTTVEAVRQRAVGGAFEPWRRDAPMTGRDRTQVQAEVAIITPAGVPKQLMLRAQYVPTAEGRRRLTGLLIDITDKKMAEQRLAVVARELQHRVKNSLSIVQAIARQSLRGKTNADEALDAFLGRIRALAAATDLILERSAAAAELGEAIERITRPYRERAADPFRIAGPSVQLPPNTATAIGMVLHELCTNALKYGALSAAAGEVAIAWHRPGDGHLHLTWQESGGPATSPPKRKGFGSRLIENVVTGELGGKVSLDFAPGGLYCAIEVPLS